MSDPSYKWILYVLPVVALALFSFKHVYPTQTVPNKGNWCDKPLRPGLAGLHEVKTSHPWFKVYDVGHNTYAIDEPYNWEETISYLIIGKSKALLFDTGMGLDSISAVVKQLTKLPIIVLNSHTHPDHIGCNTEFSEVLAMDTRFTRQNAANGYPHNDVRWEVSPGSFCPTNLPHADTARYFIRRFKPAKYIKGGYRIDIGGRKLEVIATPGHTPDAICLYDAQAKYLWCGDSFYEGPILLSVPETDLQAYKHSIELMARFAAVSNRVLPAHNLPVADPALIKLAATDFNMIVSGKKKGRKGDDNSLSFDCGKFSYLINGKLL